MSRAIPWLAAVGTVLAVVAVMGWIWADSALPPAVFTGQAVACYAAAAFLELRRRRERAVPLPDVSYPVVALALGATMMLSGVAFGLWLVLIGAGVAAFGLGGLARELLAARRAVK